jgi:hypothetical protein
VHKIGISHVDIVRYVKAQRIRWIGHIVRMDKERAVKRITKRRGIAVRWTGRLRFRWEGDVGEGLGRIKIQNWSKMAMDRKAWKRVVGEAKTYKELYCRENTKI